MKEDKYDKFINTQHNGTEDLSFSNYRGSSFGTDGPRRVKSVSRLYLVLFLLLILAGSTLQTLYFEVGVVITQLVLILLPAVIFLRLHHRLNRDFTRLKAFPLRQAPFLVIIMISSLALVLGYGVVLGIFLERMGWSIPEFLPPPQTLEILLLYFFLIALLPGICEEVLFRGTIMPLLEPQGLLTALFFSSMLFALFHLSLIRLPGTFILGFVIGLVVLKTGSLPAGMFMHVLNNGVAVTFMYFAAAAPQQLEHEVAAQSGYLFLLLLPLAAAGLYFGFKKLGGPPVLRLRQNLLPRGWFNLALLLSLLLFLLMAFLEVLILSGAFDHLLRIFLNAQ